MSCLSLFSNVCLAKAQREKSQTFLAAGDKGTFDSVLNL